MLIAWKIQRHDSDDQNALPNLQQITIGHLGNGHKWSDGEDPNEEQAARTAHYTTHDIGIISNFSKLCILEITGASLNGRYSFLFNSFPLLKELSIQQCHDLKLDLEMLAGLPSLKELDCHSNYGLTGNINSLRVLEDTIETVDIEGCENVEGNLMDLADFPHLKELDLVDTAVTGDIRNIGENDFSSLESLYLPAGVYGGTGYEVQRISEAPDVVRAFYLLKKQRPTLEMSFQWYGALSEDSPDWYERADEDEDTPPLYVRLVEAGSRVGYRWESGSGYRWESGVWKPCEVNWLDSEPDRQSNDYGEYVEAMREFASQVSIYRGFHEPPTEEVYHKVWREWEEEEEEESVNESYGSET